MNDLNPLKDRNYQNEWENKNKIQLYLVHKKPMLNIITQTKKSMKDIAH